jgi:hypothetical protein
MGEALLLALKSLRPGERFDYGFFARETRRPAQATLAGA